MLKQITVNIIVDDHEPEKCGDTCIYFIEQFGYSPTMCQLYDAYLVENYRCKQCLEEAK